MSTDQDFPVLVAQNGPLMGERWPLDHPLVMGRETGCDVLTIASDGRAPADVFASTAPALN